MLQLTINDREIFDEDSMEFVMCGNCTLQLEHSLISLSKWESKWHKPFLGNDKKTDAELLDYIRCMTLNKNVDSNIYLCLSQEELAKINEYINDPMTATTIKRKSKSTHRVVTSELIYYWMIASGIPFECEKWHLNRLITLIEVCGAESNPTKMSKNEIRKQNAAINAARRARTGSRG